MRRVIVPSAAKAAVTRASAATVRQQKKPDRVVLPYEKNLIASELGMTRESFSRTLSALQRDGISVQGDTILIVDAARLAAVSGVDPLIDADLRRNVASAGCRR
jgi:Crp-like helix-turn-helix domain